MDPVKEGIEKFGKRHEEVFKKMMEESKAPPSQSTTQWLLKEKTKPKRLVKRAKGLGELVKRYKKLKDESNKVWKEIASSCTHADQDLEFDVGSYEDTMGNHAYGEDYRLFCTVCQKTVLNKYIA